MTIDNVGTTWARGPEPYLWRFQGELAYENIGYEVLLVQISSNYGTEPEQFVIRITEAEQVWSENMIQIGRILILT